MQSGTPWNARGQDSQGSSALNYLEPAGAHRNTTWSNLDLLASYRVNLSTRANVTFEARLLNVAGNQTQTSTDSVQYLSASWSGTYPSVATNSSPNLFYGTANGYAPPRRLVLAALVSF